MVVARQPFGPAARLAAGVLATVCLAAGTLALVLAVRRRNVLAGVLAFPVMILGAVYAGAAWRGRPWSWSQ